MGLLIGVDCPRALCPLDSIVSNDPRSPFAVRTPVGWTVVGSSVYLNSLSGLSNRSVLENQPVRPPDIATQSSGLDGPCLTQSPAPIASSAVIASFRQSPNQLNYSRPKSHELNSLSEAPLAEKIKCTKVNAVSANQDKHSTSRIRCLHTRWKSRIEH